MKTGNNRIKNLSDSFASLLEQERGMCEEMISSLMESIRKLQGNTADWRLQRLAAQLKKLQERLNLLVEMARQDYLAKIEREADDLKDRLLDSRAGSVLLSLVKVEP